MSKSPLNHQEKAKKEPSLSNPKPKNTQSKRAFLRFPSISVKTHQQKANLIFYLLIILLPTQLAKHFWPNFSLLLGLRLDYLSPTLYITDVLIILLFLNVIAKKTPLSAIAIATQEVIPSWREPNNFKIKHTVIKNSLAIGNWQLVIFFIFLLIGIFTSQSIPLGLYGLLKFLEYYLLFLYIKTNKKNIHTIALLSCIPLLTESILAVAQYINQGSFGGFLYFIGERSFNANTPGIANASLNGQLILRPYATLPHPNVLAGYILITLILIYNFMTTNNKVWKTILKAAALIIGSIALCLTLSRVAILIWMMITLAAMIKKIKAMRANKKRFISLAILLAVISAGIISFHPLLTRFEQTSFTEESFIQRKDLFQASLSLIQEHPLLGVGLHNFLPAIATKIHPFSPILYIQPVHNIFLLLATEIGLPAFTLSLWFLYKTIHRLIKNRQHPSSLPLLLGIGIIIIIGLTDHYWLTLQQGQLLTTLILGLVWRKQNQL